MSAVVKKLANVDVYGLLDLHVACTTQEVRKAFRRKALSCHPDKCPDDKKAAETFLLLSECCELLLDSVTRAEYDRIQEARKTKERREQAFDVKRRKLRNDLERRESDFDSREFSATHADAKDMDAKISRLRTLGRTMVERENDGLHKTMQNLAENHMQSKVLKTNKLSVSWRLHNTSDAYTECDLRRIFNKYGDVMTVLIRQSGKSKSKYSALVEMSSPDVAELAAQLEQGLNHVTLKVKLAYDGAGSSSSDISHTGKVSLTHDVIRESTEPTSLADFEAAVLQRFQTIADS